MSFLKNVFNILTDKREIKEPEIYKEFNEKSPLITNLTRLAEDQAPNVDLKKVESHLKLFSIGQAGEKNVLFELQHSMLPMVVLHDVYLEYEDYQAQLDFVIITHKFILVLEVKKLFGNIHVTDKGEFQRVIKKNHKTVNKEGMYSPINQVERHVAILEKILKDQKTIQNCPVKYAVTFANPKTILDVSKKAAASIHSSVIRHDQIKQFIKSELDVKSPVFMADHHVYNIADTILKYSKEKPFNIEDYILNKSYTPHNELTNEQPIANDRSNSSDDEYIKKSLSTFRSRRSKELNVKPYLIFTNKILDSLIERKPETKDQLLEIEGIGPKKVEEFGEDLLAIINKNHTDDHVAKKPDQKIQSQNLSREGIKTALIDFRTKRSKELNVKPFYIFTNNTLEFILDKQPETIKDLLEIEGIGPKKAEDYGQEILDIVKTKN